MTRADAARFGISTTGAAGERAAVPAERAAAADEHRSPPAAGDRGAVTVEAALALSVLVLVLAGALAAVACLVGHLRCVDAAREAARLAARGDDAGAAAVVQRFAPPGARLRWGRDGGLVTATVWCAAAGGWLPGITLSATAVAAAEPGVEGGAP